MKVSRLLKQIRIELDDDPSSEANRLWSDIELAGYADEGAIKLCQDTRILRDSSTVGETLATATITLTGTAGSISTVKVNGVTVTSAAVPFNATLTQTAIDLAANITAYTSTPNYTATSSGETVTISAIAGTGSNPNDYTVVITCSGGDMAVASTVMANGTSLCRLYLLVGVSEYEIDSRVIQIDRLKPTDRYALEKKTVDWMDENRPGWEETASGTPVAYISDISPNRIAFYPPPDTAETLKATIVRQPLTSMLVDENTVNYELEIELKDPDLEGVKLWAKHCALQKEGAETLRPEKASYYASGDPDRPGLYEKFVEKVKRRMLLANAMG